MLATITRRYSMECAHYLPKVHKNHKCSRMHGHNFKVDVTIKGPINENSGWVMDFQKLDDIFAGQVHYFCDHRLLNEIDGLDNPTSENIARWIWVRLWETAGQLAPAEWPVEAKITAVTVWEIDGFSTTYRGESA